MFGLFAGFASFLGLATYFVSHGWLEEIAVSNLEALTSSRYITLKMLIANKLAHLKALSEYHLAHYVRQVAKTQDGAKSDFIEALERRIDWEIASVDNVEGICLYRPDGSVITCRGALYEEMTDYKDTKTLLKARHRSIVLDPIMHQGHFALDLMAPVRSAKGDVLAVLLVRYDGQNILAVTGDYTGLGESGETVLGVRKGDLVFFLAPLRFDPGISQTQPAEISGQRAKPMLHATSGQSGLTRSFDYRKVEVLAAYRPIRPPGWGLVVKQDVSEAFSNSNRLQIILFFLWLILITISLIATLFLVRVFMRPVKDLHRATEKVSGGDLSVKVPEESEDELGRLARSFNRMIDRMNNAQREQERSNRELTSFAYVVSHDLRAPLRAIFNLSQWLQEDLSNQLQAEHKKQLGMLREQATRMDSLIKGLLEYSRVGRTDTDLGWVNTDLLVQQIIQSMGVSERFSFEIGALPRVYANKVRITQVLQNLIDNAVHHHPGPNGRVEVTCEKGPEGYTFSIKDDGVGIEPRYHERIFNMFQTLSAARDLTDNTGIGLALVKRIVEEHGGRVWVVSSGEAGRGADFRFNWPKIVPEE